MTSVRFVGGMADGEFLDFPEYTILSELFPVHSADGNGMELYELEYDPAADPQYRYLFMGKGETA